MNDKPSPKLSQKGDGPLPVWVYPLVTITLWVVGIWLFLHFFSAARIVLLGVLAAGALAAAVWPLARRVPGPRWLGGIAAVLAPVLIALGLIALVGWLLGSRLQEEMGQWPALRDGFNTLLDRVNSYLGLRDRITIETVWTNVRSFFNVSDLVSTATGFASGLLLAAVLLVFGAIYLLAEDPQRLIAPVVSLFRPRRREQIRGALGDLAPKLRWWLIGTLVSMAIVAAVSWIGFLLIGLPLALSLALLAGFSEIVPTIGPAVAFLIAFLFALSQGTYYAVGVTVIYAVNQLIESYVLLPIVTLFTVVLWSKVFGILGLLLTLPIDLTIWSFFKHLLVKDDRE